jgi:hypothetical protein
MRESLAHAINSGDLEQHEYDCAIDKVHAMGATAIDCPLGILTIRFIDGQQPKSYRQLVVGLVGKASIQFKCARPMMEKMCEQAVREEVFPFCRACDGRKEIKVDERVIQCHVCEGSGKHRHTDSERARALGVDIGDYAQWGKRYQMVQSIFSDNYQLALRQIKHRLIESA